MEETKKVLEKQLQLLSEQVEQNKDNTIFLPELTKAMCEVSDALSRSEAMYRDTYNEAYRDAFHEKRNLATKDHVYQTERELVNRCNRLWIPQVLTGLAIIIHIVFGH